jgi:hypothetical protein
LKILNISQVDAVFTNGIYPIEMVIFYNQKLSTPKIRAALKTISTDFWPLFGEYRAGQICFARYSEEECLAEETFDQKCNLNATPLDLFEKFVRLNPLPLKKLFHLKIIQYANGTVLIPKMDHLAGDGYSYFYFLSVLAAITRSNSFPLKKYMTRLFWRPQHRRTVLRDFLSETSGLKPPVQDAKFIIKNEEIPKAEIFQLIREIKNKFNTTVSTNDLLSALALKKVVLLKQDCFKESIQLTIPMDVRRYIAEYGRRYFGNALQFAVTDFNTSAVMKSDVHELAMQIRERMPVVTREQYLNYLQGLEKLIGTKQWDKLRPFDPRQGCLVTNLTKLPTDKLDFGGGRPDFIFPLTIEKNSVALLMHAHNYLLRLAYLK